MKLSEIIKLEPRQSKVLVPCEIDPSHEGTYKYLNVSMDRKVPTAFNGGEELKTVTLSINICDKCANQFAYDALARARDLA